MPPRPRSFASTLVCVIAVLATGASLNSWRISDTLARQSPDTYGAQRAVARFSGVLQRVPQAAEVAYFSDLPEGSTAALAAFMTTQNAIAPRFLLPVEKAGRAQWAVGNFSRRMDFATLGSTRGFELIEDFDNGAVLYRRRAK